MALAAQIWRALEVKVYCLLHAKRFRGPAPRRRSRVGRTTGSPAGAENVTATSTGIGVWGAVFGGVTITISRPGLQMLSVCALVHEHADRGRVGDVDDH